MYSFVVQFTRSRTRLWENASHRPGRTSWNFMGHGNATSNESNPKHQWRWGDEWRAEYPGTLPWRTAAVRMRASTWAGCRLKVGIFEDFSGWTHISWIMNIYQNLSIWIFEYIINYNNIFINYCHTVRTGQFTTYHQISQIIARTHPNLPCFN